MKINASDYCLDCSCGEHHDIPVKSIVLEPGAIHSIEDILGKLGFSKREAVAVYDENTYAACPIHPDFKHSIILRGANIHTEEKTFAIVESEAPECSVFVAVGSGTVNDVVRIVAARRGIPFVSVPTACSVDGFLSGSSSVTVDGCKRTVWAKPPIACIADTDILTHAPLRLALSGFGDIMGKYIALADWQLGAMFGTDKFCPYIADLQRKATDIVFECSTKLASGDPEAYENLMYALLLSGMAMQMFGDSRPASGAEHYISHSWEMHLFGINTDALHGEKVGVGTLMALKKYEYIAADFPAFVELLDWKAPSEALLRKTLGELFNPLVGELTDDKLNYVDGKEALLAHADDITAIYRALPSYSSLKAVYEAIGAKSTLESVDIPSRFYEPTLKWSPFVRNRLTMLRIATRES